MPKNTSPSIPHDRFDSSLALLSDPYRFVRDRCRTLGRDAFRTRMMLRRVVCASGEEAAHMFYHPGRFTRVRAMPPTVLKLLQDKGSVHQLDGGEHRVRKQMFMSLMTSASIESMATLAERQLQSCLGRWSSAERIVLLHEAQQILCAAACEWAGIPSGELDLERRTREFSAMVSGAAAIGPRNWRGMLLRSRTERWARGLIERVRAGTLQTAPDSALSTVAGHVDADGRAMSTAAAAVELLNLLRPTVAVAWYIVHVAHALHANPQWRERLRAGNDDDATAFANEVRRWYPFFPVVGGRVREPFEWRGTPFRTGDWVLLDLYGTNRDPAAWQNPDAFDPQRFRRWDGNAFTLVPQGGGDHHADHRCPGEWITIALMKRFAIAFSRLDYRVPPQDLELDMRHPPAIPADGFVIDQVKVS